jgi:fructose-bisphosphate aldolase class I
LDSSPDELLTEGLEGLPDRLAEYRRMGARFTKWRAVIRIGPGLPTVECVRANAQALGTYAAVAQQAGLVQIVEPEVLMDGAHDIRRCGEVTEQVLMTVFEAVVRGGCLLDGMVLKPNMVVPGSEAASSAKPEEVARATVAVLRNCVPPEVPGIAFLSGGQTGPEACANLNAMAALSPRPWKLSFSFGRALQYPALAIWNGESSKVAAAQEALLHRARMSSLAAAGEYSQEMEDAGVPTIG